MPTTSGNIFLTQLSYTTNDDDSDEHRNYFGIAGVVLFLMLSYITMTVAITAVFSKVKKTQYCEEINKNSNSKKIGDKLFMWHFIFLQLCIIIRLILCSVLLLRLKGYLNPDDNLKRVWLVRLFYNLSIVFLCVAFSIQLYTLIFILHRINLYGGVFQVEQFRKRQRLSQAAFTLVTTGLLIFNTLVIFWETALPSKVVIRINATLMFIEFTSLLICFAVTGQIVYKKLLLFFEKIYNMQRTGIIAQLVMIITSLAVLNFKFVLEYIYCITGTCGEAAGQGSDFPPLSFSDSIAVAIVLLSDLMPIFALIINMWIGSKGEIDFLISGYLQKPSEDDRTTFAGSQMLDGLKFELGNQDQMLSSQDSNSLKQDRFPPMLLESVYSYDDALLFSNNLKASYHLQHSNEKVRPKQRTRNHLSQNLKQIRMHSQEPETLLKSHSPHSPVLKTVDMNELMDTKKSETEVKIRNSMAIPKLKTLNTLKVQANTITRREETLNVQSSEVLNPRFDSQVSLNKDDDSTTLDDPQRKKETLILSFDPTRDFNHLNPKTADNYQKNQLDAMTSLVGLSQVTLPNSVGKQHQLD